MKKVIYRPVNPLPNQRDIVEYTEASNYMIKLRASALNWHVVSIEFAGKGTNIKSLLCFNGCSK